MRPFCSFPLLLGLLLFTLSALAQRAEVLDISVTGNSRTREVVILREVPFSVGDSIDLSKLTAYQKQITQNLTNTSLFNFVEVKYIVSDSTLIRCNIDVDERWYIWPGVIFSLAETNIHSWWQNKDFERINYGAYLQDFNFRGRREKLTLNFQYGWKRKIGLNYQIPGLNKKRTLGAGLEVYYANNREINYSSLYGERQFFKDSTFVQEEFAVISKLEYRPRFLNTHRFNLGVNSVSIEDTILSYANDYLSYEATVNQYLYMSYGFKREKRDNRAYPLTGYLIDGSLDQRGVGLIGKDNLQLTELLMTFNVHHHLGGRWYFAHGMKGKSTLRGTPPYYLQRGLGYGNNYIRGYELEVIDGQHYALYKSNLKYELLKKRVLDLKLPVLKKFDKFHYSVFLNAFGDAGYVVDQINAAINPLANTVQYSYGLGLDLVTYYDLVVRFEGSLNKDGKPAFFINFRNPI